MCSSDLSLPSVERLAGFRSACADARVEVDDALVRPGRYDYASGLEQGRELLRLPEPPTAVLALNDTIAVGVLEAARRHGLRVPEDLSVVGFDDSSIAALSSPLLTTVRQPLHDIGVEAVRIVTQARASGRVGGSPVEMQTSLVVRSSTGPAPHRPRT